MTIFDFYALLASLLLDIFAPLSVIGSAILAVGGVVSARFGRRFRAPEQIYMWSWGGLFIGIGGLICIMISDQVTLGKTMWFGFSMTTIVVMLFVSLLLLVAGKMLQSRIRPPRQTFPTAPRRVRAKSYQ